MQGLGLVRARHEPARRAVLPQQITEFTNSGMTVGIATVNMAADPFEEFNGFWGACSTYGSFSYLKYGPMRLFSQLAQDCELKVGKVLWVAGHSGPETAEDSRTHFGIFETGRDAALPRGPRHRPAPVGVQRGAGGARRRAAAERAPIVALHLTRPAIEIPDRAALGMASHFEAARGAYVMRAVPRGPAARRHGLRAGHITTANVVKILPKLDELGLNVKIVAAISPQLFALQDEAYRDERRVARRPLGRDGRHQPRAAAMRHWIGARSRASTR